MTDTSASSAPPVPCCPQDVEVSLLSTDTLEITWSAVKGAELYETTAAQTDDVIHCNDTAPMCALSDLSCNTDYSVTVTPCSDFRGCNQTCAPRKHRTGVSGARLNESVEKMHVSCKMSAKNMTTSTHFSLGNLLLQLHVLRRS